MRAILARGKRRRPAADAVTSDRRVSRRGEQIGKDVRDQRSHATATAVLVCKVTRSERRANRTTTARSSGGHALVLASVLLVSSLNIRLQLGTFGSRGAALALRRTGFYLAEADWRRRPGHADLDTQRVAKSSRTWVPRHSSGKISQLSFSWSLCSPRESALLQSEEARACDLSHPSRSH